jgi:uncharacterized protein
MNKPFRILALNGGGIRGIFQAVFLNKISKELTQPLWSNFDLICATSTGSISGMALAMGVDLSRIIDLYKSSGEKLFRRKIFSGFSKGPIYNQKILKDGLIEIFQNNQLKEAKTKVLITSASINRFDHKVFANFPTITRSDENLSIVDVVLSSTAAPTYFLPVTPIGQERSFVDGGLWANAPSSLGILFANKYLGIPIGNIKLISVGTGEFPAGATIDYFNNLRQFSIKTIRTIFELMLSSQSSFADHYASEVLGEENYLRVSANLDEVIGLDDAKEAIIKLPPLAEQAAEIYQNKISRLLKHEVRDEIIIQDVSRNMLISDYLVNETGLTAFYPSREYYRIREGAGSIDSYINTAKDSLILVSISLVKGINFDNLRIVLQRKLEKPGSNFHVTISLLNPSKKYLMESLSLTFEKNNEDLAKDISDGISKLVNFKQTLSLEARRRFNIMVHNSIPFASAVILDSDKSYGKIQIETKAYKVPYGKSFAFEVIPIKKDGFYDTILKGYIELLRDGEIIDGEVTYG